VVVEYGHIISAFCKSEQCYSMPSLDSWEADRTGCTMTPWNTPLLP
jgi:hypothetical protein